MGAEDRSEGSVLLGRYRLESCLGRGGFGTVWRATDLTAPERPLAIKILHPELSKDPSVRRRFEGEAETLAKLTHPGIARLIGFEASSDDVFLVMEHVAGRPLRVEIADRAREARPFSLEEVATIIGAIADALRHAHARGVVHRDLKPANVLVFGAGAALSLRVVDFGLAKVIDGSKDGTTVGRILGSPLYLSPEQIRGAPVDARADVFALATVAFELLTLRWAWARDWDDRPLAATVVPPELAALNHPIAVTQRITAGLRPKASPHRGELPEAAGAELDRVLGIGLAIEPSERFADIAGLEAALRAALPLAAPVSVPDTRIVPTPIRALPMQPRERPRGWAPIAIGLALIATFFLSRAEPRPAPVAPHPVEVEPTAPPGPSVRPRQSPPPAVLEPELLTPAPRPRSAPRTAPKAEPPPAPRDSEVDLRLAELEAEVDDYGAAAKLSQALIEAADRLPRSEDRTSIKRCATSAMVPVDVAALRACVGSWRARAR